VSAWEREGRFRRAFEDAAVGKVLLGTDGRWLEVNRALCEMLGYRASELLGRTLGDLGAADLEVEMARRMAAGEGRFHLEGCLRPEGGNALWVSLSASLMGDVVKGVAQGAHVYLAEFQDVTAQRRDRAQLRRQADFRGSLITLVEASLQGGLNEAFYQHLMEVAVRVIPGAQAGSLLLRAEGGTYRFVASVNFDQAVLAQTFLYEHELHRAPNVAGLQVIYGFDNLGVEPSRRDPLYEAGETDKIKVSMSIPVEMEGRVVAYFNLDNFDRADAFDDEATEMGRLFAQQVAALWQRLRLEADLRSERAALERLAFYDPLTGLPNRSLLKDRLEQALARGARSGGFVVLMFLDLDDFKHVNDTLGHGVGDDLLAQVGQRLRGCVREGDTVARWGGDEFVILLTDVSKSAAAAAVADKVLRCFDAPFRPKGFDVRTTASIGIDLYPEPARGADDLVRHADIALYRAKLSGKNTYRFFTEEMNRRLRARLKLEADLRGALLTGALTLHYQPRIDLRTGAVTSFEALVRWPHPERGLVLPGDFIPLAEETGLIIKLGERVLHMACTQAKAWCLAGHPHRVAVNLSVKQLKQEGVVATVEGALRAHGLEPHLLELEVTESAAMTEVHDSITKLKELRALGVHLSLDDFGSAYSSLGYLKRLPFNSLKIDSSFVRELGPGAQGSHEASIVQAIVALGQSLGLTVIAEGVETPFQRDLLRRLGCDEAQGYLFSRPLPEEKVAAFLHPPGAAPERLLS